MLELNPDIVRDVIQYIREFQTQDDVDDPDVPDLPDEPDATAADDWATRILERHGDDPTYGQVVDAVSGLEPDQQVLLVALMWVGRGDYAPDEGWDDAVRQAQDQWNGRVAEYLLGTPLAADFLEEGLSQLGYADD